MRCCAIQLHESSSTPEAGIREWYWRGCGWEWGLGGRDIGPDLGTDIAIDLDILLAVDVAIDVAVDIA